LVQNSKSPCADFSEPDFVSPSWPSFEKILAELKTVLANTDFVIEGYVDPTEPLRDEGPFGDHTGYYTLPGRVISNSERWKARASILVMKRVLRACSES
jgi:hypothetical protein